MHRSSRGIGRFPGLLAGLVALTTVGAATAAEQALSAVRHLPDSYHRAESLVVTIDISPGENSFVHAVEETFPAGWAVEEISHEGKLAPDGDSIRWLFMDQEDRSISYRLTPPPDASGVAGFDGAVTAGDESHTTEGDQTLPPSDSEAPPPADPVEPPDEEPDDDPSPPDPAEETSAQRNLPDDYQPGEPFAVVIEVDPASGGAYTVEEIIPGGWTADDIANDGRFVPSAGAVRWFFPDTESRSLSYTVTPPHDAAGDAAFSGTIVIDGDPLAIDKEELSGRTYPIQGALSVTSREGARVPESPGGAVSARKLPQSYVPGQPFSVKLEIQPGSRVRGYSVEEKIPEGWLVSDISDGGEHDPENNLIRWDGFRDGEDRVLSFQVLPPPGAAKAIEFSGTVIIDAVAVGGSSITVEP